VHRPRKTGLGDTGLPENAVVEGRVDGPMEGPEEEPAEAVEAPGETVTGT
jgi:UDP-GlcNAc:undecaprenyl-phosphate GlcNAc-1-phosphate transferase